MKLYIPIITICITALILIIITASNYFSERNYFCAWWNVACAAVTLFTILRSVYLFGVSKGLDFALESIKDASPEGPEFDFDLVGGIWAEYSEAVEREYDRKKSCSQPSIQTTKTP